MSHDGTTARGGLKCILKPPAMSISSVDGRLFSMASGETIHTENSFKYDPRDARMLLRAGGWTPIADWTDEKEFFSLILAKVATSASAPNHVNRRPMLRVMERHDGNGGGLHNP